MTQSREETAVGFGRKPKRSTTGVVSWCLIAGTCLGHVLWVWAVATAVDQGLSRGDDGMQLWTLVAVPDLPVYVLAIVIDECGWFPLNSNASLYWVFTVGGSCQWGLLVWSLLRLWQRRRDRDNRPRCVRCGYLLIGNVSGICPECGESVSEGESGVRDRDITG